MPVAQVEAVPAVSRFTCGATEIIEISRCSGGVVLMISGSRTSACFVPSPGFVIALEVELAAIGIGQVSEGQHGSRQLVQEFRGCFRAGEIGAVNNISGSDYGLVPARCLQDWFVYGINGAPSTRGFGVMGCIRRGSGRALSAS